MSRVGIHWADDRIGSQRIAPRTASTLPSAKAISRELIGTRTEVRRRGGIVPPWVIFGMIILAALGLCITVTARTHAQRHAASSLYQRLQQDVEARRRSNAALERELQRLQSKDPKAIESAARSQFNMTRPNETFVPVK